MLHELDQPAFVEIVEKASDVSVHDVVHLLLQERIGQRIQRIMLAALRAKTVREAEKVFLVDLVEDSDHGLLDNLIFQSRDPLVGVAAHLLSLCTPSVMASLEMLPDELGHGGQLVVPPARSHTPAT